MPSLLVLILALSMIACGDDDRRPENQSSNPLYPSGPEQVQRSQIVTVEGASVSEAEVVIIDAERLVVLARAPVDDQGGFEVSVLQRSSYWLGVSGPYMATHVDTAFVFTGEVITIGEAPRSDAAGKAAQAVGILGDVNNDNQVDIADALLVLLYTLERISFVAPNKGNIFLGDVNQDGLIDLADVLHIMTYIANPLDPTLPDGIGLASDRDRAVLIAFYEATDGANWDENTNWLISTYSLDQWNGVYTDDKGRVTGLDLAWNGLTGPIPEALGNLNNLQSLDLRGNQLTGTIPEALGQLDSLKTLNLWHNQLTGTIPEALGQLNRLSDLRLDRNELTGPIPSVLSQLDNLGILDLNGNQLTGCIPLALYAISNNDLHLLGLYSCHIYLVEDPQVVALVALYESTGGDNWDDNTKWLSGRPLSEWFGVETDENGQITSLNLGGNQLTGPIPEALGQLENLQYLRLNYNQLMGPIPETLGNLNNLQYLYLDDNQLTGSIPEALGQLENLRFLHLKGNELTGCIPSALRAIPNNDLRHLRLDFCQ